MKTFTFHVHGMHCKSCEMMIESELSEVPYVTKAKSSLKSHTVEVSGYFGEMEITEAAETLTRFIRSHGYTLSIEKEQKAKNFQDFKIAIPIALGFALLFVILQKIGIVNLVSVAKMNYGTAFMIGIIASLSTCMAVVGGLVLSMSATFASTSSRDAGLRGAGKVKPILLFHTGRIISFFILGGVIGVIGSAFTLNTTATFILGLLIGLLMLGMGLNLLEVFHFAKKFQPAMPKFIGKHARGITKFNHAVTPLLVGIATFFLPCGFTQSMQIYTLSTGSFLIGALTMFSFATGTLPVLALLSFSSFSIQKSSWRGIFFKTAGLIIIMFALFNLFNSFAINLPTERNYTPAPTENVKLEDGKQIIEIMAKGGYLPKKTVAKSGMATTLRFDSKNTFDCSSSVRIPSLGISRSLDFSGSTDVDLGTPAAGLLKGSCSMGMYRFEIDFIEE